MKEITATQLARNLRKILDDVENRGDEVIVVRNKQKIAQILPGPGRMNALEAMADLYRTIPDEAAAGWAKQGRLAATLRQLRNRWDS